MLTELLLWIIVLMQSLQLPDTETQVYNVVQNIMYKSVTEDGDTEYVFFAEL